MMNDLSKERQKSQELLHNAGQTGRKCKTVVFDYKRDREITPLCRVCCRNVKG